MSTTFPQRELQTDTSTSSTLTNSDIAQATSLDPSNRIPAQSTFTPVSPVETNSSPTSPFQTTSTTGIAASNSTFKTSAPVTTSTGITQSQTASPGKHGLGSGAAAGLAIGCLLAGFVVASIIFFLLLRRYQARQKPQTDYADHLGAQNGGHVSAYKDNAVVSVIEKYIPQPAEDDAISGEMSKLRDRIKNHAQSYYHTAPVDPSQVDEAPLQALSQATGMTAAVLKDRLLNPQTRLATIRLWISWVILSRYGGSGGNSLLPPEVIGFTELMADPRNTDPSRMTLMSKWKSMSGAILNPRYNGQAAENDPRNRSIQECLAVIDVILAPFIGSLPEPTKRLLNLESIVRKATQFALLLFSQPSFWGFEWAAPRGGVVIFPALLQLVNEEMHTLSPPRVFSQAEIVRDD